MNFNELSLQREQRDIERYEQTFGAFHQSYPLNTLLARDFNGFTRRQTPTNENTDVTPI